MRLVITGTGRSGTGYCAQVLRACGVACGHESVLSPPVAMGWRPPEWEGFEADASWLAAAVPAADDAHTILVVRHPAAVVRSWLQLGVLEESNIYLDVIAKITPSTLHGRTPEDRALRHWINWTILALSSADEIVRVEHLADRDLMGWLAKLDHGSLPVSEVLEALATPTDVNAKADAKQAWPLLRRPMFDRRLLHTADHLAGWLGYPDWLTA